MEPMDRQEHLQWAKDRAYEYLDDGHTAKAIASILSDLSKHPDTAGHSGITRLAGMLLLSDQPETLEEVRSHISGFR